MWHFPSKSKHFFQTYDNFQLQKLKFDQKFSSESFKVLQNISSKAPDFDENLLTSPHFLGNLSAHKPPSSEMRAAHTY